MPLVSMKDMLNKAKAEGYAVGQFNLNNLEFTQAILQAAEEEKSPVILGVSEGAARYMAEGNVQALGQLMTEAEEKFDKYVAPMSPALRAPKSMRIIAN